MKKFPMVKTSFKIILRLILVGILIYALYWRYRLGVVRYFDADEFSYLFWGYNFHWGLRPYTDFFYFLPPFFLFPVSILFEIFGRSLQAVEAARISAFAVFVILLFPVFLITRKLSGTKTALVGLIVFSVLPLPYDKMIEIRPDTLGLVFMLLGLYFFLKAFENIKGLFLLSGMFIGISLCVIPKTVPFLLPLIPVLVYKLYKEKTFKKRFAGFVLGFVIPVIIAVILIFSYKAWPVALQFMTQFAAESTKILGDEYFILPNQFFSPIDAYYGIWGHSLPNIYNLVVYIVAFIWMAFRLVSSFCYKDEKRCIGEFIFSSAFLINFYAYVNIYPLKHAQYLIPLAPFVGFYAADFVVSLANWIARRTGKIIKGKIGYIVSSVINTGIVLSFAVVSIYMVEQMNRAKIWWGNYRTYANLAQYLKDIPAGVPVMDLSGETIFYPTGYYFCCLPYGQYAKALRFPYPEITADMTRRNTKYIHTGALGMGGLGGIIPSQAKYIKDNFKPFYPDNSMLIKK